MNNLSRWITVAVVLFLIVGGLLIAAVGSAGILLKAIVVLIGFMFLVHCSTRLGAAGLFYAYITTLFYADYAKLVFPSLPIGFFPDAVLLVFLLRIFLWEPKRANAVFLSKEFFVPNVIAGIYLLFNFLQIFNPALPSFLMGLQTFRAVFKIVILYWGALWVLDSEDKVYSLIKLLAVNSFFVFLFAFKQIFLGFSRYELAVYNPGVIRRIYSFSTNPAVFSLVLGMGMIYWYLEALFKKRFSTLFILLAFAIVSAMSFHRAPLFASLAAIVLITALNLKQWGFFVSSNLHKALFWFFTVILTVSFIFVAPLPPRYAEMRGEILDRFVRAKKGVQEEGMQVRVKQLAPAIEAIKKYPLGGGLGYTQLRFGSKLDDFAFFKGIYNASYKVNLPTGTGDNTFLSVAIETGWVGVIYFIFVLLYGLFSTASKLLIAETSSETRYFLSFSFGLVALVSLSIITSSIYFLVMAGALFWLGLGLAQVSWKMRKV